MKQSKEKILLDFRDDLYAHGSVKIVFEKGQLRRLNIILKEYEYNDNVIITKSDNKTWIFTLDLTKNQDETNIAG